ncbi:lactate dehydrogenase A [Linderina pennispora]|uniref:L-lactate dehydrogenase n=1 Tax=Linderina pennispora TaxID=61395 RepID=A0A1Y1W6W0_9FUNG|nr:lactate dehydrogenase A [Linderina pennispora]ORX69162.1 lactate dehydrogenase A [Linderina pennispora]
MAPGCKVAVIGSAGNVGASVVFSLVNTTYPADIMMVDVNQRLVRGQAMDLADAAWPTGHRVRTANLKEAGQADLIIITAGARQQPGELRDGLLDRNYEILHSILSGLKPVNPNAVVLMISNPVDVLTGIAQNITGLPKSQVFGSGTLLDSGRLRNYLAKLINVRQTSIHCHVLGEHGDSQFVGWSSARIGGVKLDQFPEMQTIDKAKIEHDIARTAYDIIEAKGATYYGVGVCGAILATSVLQNQHDIRSVCCHSTKWGGYVSTPAVICSRGIDRVLELDLDNEETEKMEHAVERIKGQTKRFVE